MIEQLNLKKYVLSSEKEEEKKKEEKKKEEKKDDKKEDKKEEKKKKPLMCLQERTDIQMICVDASCKNKFVLLCKNFNCSCYKEHKKCKTYNFSKLKSHYQASSNNIQDLFKNTIGKIEATIEILINQHEKLKNKWKQFESGHFPQIYELLTKEGKVQKETSSKIFNFYEPFIHFTIPAISNCQIYKNALEESLRPALKTLIENRTNLQSGLKQFFQKFTPEAYHNWIKEANTELTARINQQQKEKRAKQKKLELEQLRRQCFG